MIASEVFFTIIIVSPLNSCHWNPFYISLHQVLYLPKQQYRKKIEEKRNHNNTCDDVIPSSLSTFFTKILVLVLF